MIKLGFSDREGACNHKGTYKRTREAEGDLTTKTKSGRRDVWKPEPPVTGFGDGGRRSKTKSVGGL